LIFFQNDVPIGIVIIAYFSVSNPAVFVPDPGIIGFPGEISMNIVLVHMLPLPGGIIRRGVAEGHGGVENQGTLLCEDGKTGQQKAYEKRNTLHVH
jgi:hypothetical protein